MPGGIAELFEARHGGPEGRVLRRRKGFVKLALQTGAPLVPLYCFGNTDIFHVFRARWLCRLSRRAQVSLQLFWGRWCLPLPYKRKLLLVVGTPVGGARPPVAEPTAEEVDALHARYVAELEALFHRHKARLPGWESRELVIT